MAVVFSNNAATTLSSSLTSSATSVAVVDGSVFPTLGSGYCYLTLEDVSDNREIVKCTAISGNTLTVVRAQDNTSARAFSAADKCELRLTAAGLNDVADQAVSDSPTFVDITATSLDISGDIDVDGAANLDVVDIDGAVNMASTLQVDGAATFTGAVTANAGVVVDNFTLDGTSLTLSTGNMELFTSGSNHDILFKGNDGGSTITALQLDMSAAGAATFNSNITSGGHLALSQTGDFANTGLTYHTNGWLYARGGDNGIILKNRASTVEMMRIKPTEVVINDDAIADLDFRVESNNNTHMLFVDAGNDAAFFGGSDKRGFVNIETTAVNYSSGVFNAPHLALQASSQPDDNDGFVGITFATSDSDNYGWSAGAERTSSGVGDFVFTEHNNSATGSEKLRITQSGAATFSSSVDATNYKINGSQGTDGQVLTSTGSGVAWEDASGGGGGGFTAPEVKTANWSVANSDKGKVFIVNTNGLTLTLPEDSTLDDDWFIRVYVQKDVQPYYGGVGSLTIDPQYYTHGGRINRNLTWTTRSRQGGILYKDPVLSGNYNFDCHSTNWDFDINSASGANRANANGFGSVAISSQATAGGIQAVAIGYQANATTSYTVALGGAPAQATAAYAVAIGNARASGQISFAANIGSNTSSYGAIGNRSVAMGYLSKASATNSVCISNTSVASGTDSIAIGGSNNLADKDYSIAKGYYGNTNGVRGKEAFGNGEGRQRAQYCLAIDTTDATATVMGVNFNTGGSLSADNQLVIPNNTVMAFSGLVTCRQQAADGTDSAAFEVKGLLRREGSAGTTTLVSSLVNTISNAQSFGVALSANTTLGSLSITVTGAASHDLRWVAQLDTAESTYA